MCNCEKFMSGNAGCVVALCFETHDPTHIQMIFCIYKLVLWILEFWYFIIKLLPIAFGFLNCLLISKSLSALVTACSRRTELSTKLKTAIKLSKYFFRLFICLNELQCRVLSYRKHAWPQTHDTCWSVEALHPPWRLTEPVHSHSSR